ncbi:TauD/TfdA family dioxygenase [Variovorax rhizosphaerae]|uniref:TauD/TfdA family dioxygenase n=1 Tax=Variovorax rhizosphaerae TaxID=1836200 RepID=A0ABU8WDH4_9BURK
MTTTASIPAQDFEVLRFDAPVGAEIIGLDISKPINETDFARIHRAHLDHHVVVFRAQDVSPEAHIDFSRRFGPLEIHVLHQYHLKGHPEILIVSNIKENGEPIGLGDAGAYWHSDISYKDKPSLGSLLHAQELPSEGGDTLFADQHLAWEALSPETQQHLLPLKAEHSYLAKYEELRSKNPWRPKLSQEQIDKVAPAIQPVVRTHPETGCKALFVSEHFTTGIVGLPKDESDALLAELFAHSVKPEFVYRHQWKPHDLVFWDNRSLMHLAAGTPDELRRKLYRTTIQGDLPF